MKKLKLVIFLIFSLSLAACSNQEPKKIPKEPTFKIHKEKVIKEEHTYIWQAKIDEQYYYFQIFKNKGYINYAEISGKTGKMKVELLKVPFVKNGTIYYLHSKGVNGSFIVQKKKITLTKDGNTINLK
jgi:hypothetical protein